ncbi:MAG: hypothetical protein WCY25_07620 [Moheibacter sp.]
MKTNALETNGFFSLILISIFLTSCATRSVYIPPAPVVPIYKSVPYGKIVTDGVEITAEDGSFTLLPNEIWTPPFQNETSGYGINKPDADMVNLYKVALHSMGAKQVRVRVPYQSEPLYGVLLLSKVHPESTAAVTRSYQISIPEGYVAAAQNGKISVLYEYYDMPKTNGTYGISQESVSSGLIGFSTMTSPSAGFSIETSPKTWVLWLSDIPFSY